MMEIDKDKLYGNYNESYKQKARFEEGILNKVFNKINTVGEEATRKALDLGAGDLVRDVTVENHHHYPEAKPENKPTEPQQIIPSSSSSILPKLALAVLAGSGIGIPFALPGIIEALKPEPAKPVLTLTSEPNKMVHPKPGIDKDTIMELRLGLPNKKD